MDIKRIWHKPQEHPNVIIIVCIGRYLCMELIIIIKSHHYGAQACHNWGVVPTQYHWELKTYHYIALQMCTCFITMFSFTALANIRKTNGFEPMTIYLRGFNRLIINIFSYIYFLNNILHPCLTFTFTSFAQFDGYQYLNELSKA